MVFSLKQAHLKLFIAYLFNESPEGLPSYRPQGKKCKMIFFFVKHRRRRSNIIVLVV
jgi:hypothetical protein